MRLKNIKIFKKLKLRLHVFWKMLQNLTWFCPFGLIFWPVCRSRWAGFDCDVSFFWFLDFGSISMEKQKSKLPDFRKMSKNLCWFHPFDLKTCLPIDLDELILTVMSVSSESLIFDNFRTFSVRRGRWNVGVALKLTQFNRTNLQMETIDYY